ncbi:hypothetical protein GC197_14655 [bacterium]|nr:hypothetical protein [bacterium]
MSSSLSGSTLCLACLLAVLGTSNVSAELPETLHYPKSKNFGDESITEKPFFSTKTTEEMGTVILLTPDPFDKVLAYYEKQMGGKLGSDNDKTVGLTSDKLVEGFISNDDSKQGIVDNGKSPPRDVRLVTLTKVDKEHVTTLVLSRGKTDKKTHIMLTWVRR